MDLSVAGEKERRADDNVNFHYKLFSVFTEKIIYF